jgi:hypothetical protein
MDANGYNGIGVVSPQAGVDGGQPEILAEAKRGNTDADVVSQRIGESVTGLLNGTRRSEDPQGEAYALLLTEFCRHWHKVMPFMFEREGDYTELLIPANLLADGSVLNRAVKVLTKDICQDVEVIGWLYQFYISERKDEVFAGFKKGKKAGAEEIPAATQLFTPHWIVRYLIENSLGRLWMLNRPTSRLIDQMDYFIPPVDVEADFHKINSPEEIKVIDPACGSGHMLTYAFDLLYTMYEEEGYAPSEIPGLILTNNLYGVEIDARAGGLAAFALTMKARRRQRTFFNKRIEPNVYALEPISFDPMELDLLVNAQADRSDRTRVHAMQATNGDQGDLIATDIVERANRVLLQSDILSARYHVAVANPPYMGSGNMDTQLGAFAKHEYAVAKMDLYAMFIARCLELVKTGGLVAMVTQDSWMFLGAYTRYRDWLLRHGTLCSLAHLGTAAFDTIGGEVVSTAAFIARSTPPGLQRSVFVRATDEDGPEKATVLRAAAQGTQQKRVWVRAVAEFLDVPNTPVIYWASDDEVAALRKGPHLTDLIEAREGLTTGSNDNFLRRWFEVSFGRIGFGIKSTEDSIKCGRRWFPYQKGGSSRRWYGDHDFVVDWEDDGARVRENIDPETGRVRSHNYNGAFGFRKGFTWSSISGDGFAVRHVDGGFMFDTKGPMAFANLSEHLPVVEGFLNSSTATRFMRLLAPRLDFKLGHVLSLPIRVKESSRVVELVETCINLARNDWDSSELSVDFLRSPLVSQASLVEAAVDRWCETADEQRVALAAAETDLDDFFADVYGVATEIVAVNRRTSQENPVARRRRAVEDLLSYAAGCMFGRYSLDEPGLILADQGATIQDYHSKVPAPTFRPDADNVIPIVDGDWFEDDIVARFRQFLRVAYGEQHFEENLRFITETLGVKDLRDYFVRSFYKDHVQRYRKRPIYWLFSSPKGSFNALIYMHRYTPSTVSTVLNEYLREYRAKLESSLQHHERLAAGGGTTRQQAAAQKEADRLRKVLVELEEYEHDVLYPLASQQIAIDLDDGVKANYSKFGAALKKIPGLEASE